jgi:hypothetical protein
MNRLIAWMMRNAPTPHYKLFQNPTSYKIVILSEAKNLVFLNT